MSMTSWSFATAEGLARSRLVEIAVPEIYEENAFRVLGLAVDASVRDVRRQQKKLERSERLGLNSNHHGGFLPLTPPPGEDQMRKAMHRIQDPIARFLDEFFWFWPRQPGDKHDDVLAVLWRRRVQDAHRLWLKYESQTSSDNVSTHNLAVLYHLSALDFEQKLLKENLTQEKDKTRVLCWQRSYKRWRVVLGSTDFWNRVRKRIHEIDDPQLPPQTVDDIRDCLAKAVVLIHARIATRTAERGNIAGAQQHVAIIRNSGLDQSLVQEALRDSVRTVRQRIKMLCDAAEPKADSEPHNAHTVTWTLLRDTRPLLLVMDAVLRTDDAMRLGAHDEVVKKALRCQVTYGNKTEDWRGSLKMLKAVLTFAGTDTMRERLNENIEIVKGNIAFATCHFCGKNQRVDSAAVEVQMHGDVRRCPILGGVGRYRVTWQQATVRVPRCHACKTTHESKARSESGRKSEPSVGDNLGCFGGVVGVAAGLLIMLVTRSEGMVFWGSIIIGVIFGALGKGIGEMIESIEKKNPTHDPKPKVAPIKIKGKRDYGEFRGIKELRSQGWIEGAEPSEWEQQTAPEVDPIRAMLEERFGLGSSK